MTSTVRIISLISHWLLMTGQLILGLDQRYVQHALTTTDMNLYVLAPRPWI